MPVPAPGTELHGKLLSLVRRKLQSSENALAGRYASWRKAERSYRLYVNPDEVQEPQEGVTDDAELLYTYPTSIVVPMSYAMVQTLVSFWISLFTAQRPYIRVGHRDEASAGAARAQELLLTYQLDHVGFVPFLHGWLLDACRHVGIVSNTWDTIHRNQTVRRSLTLPGPEGPIKFQFKEKKSVLEYEGNVPEVVDPFAFRPDPRWPISQFQRGGFCGEEMYRSYFELLRKQADGTYQNIREIPQYSKEHLRSNQSDRDRISGANQYFGYSMKDKENSLIMLDQVQIDLIPADHGLGGSREVERWIVVAANRAVIIRAEPFPFDHNDYTYSVIEASPDPHSFMNPSIIEIMEPIHQHVTWFMNTMLENARKSLNDRLVVDPAIVDMDDFLTPSAGKIIRINQDYWGIPGVTAGAVNQLKVTDISSQNLKHVSTLIGFLEKIAATSETLQGQVEEESRTATEISAAAQQGALRLRTSAQLFSGMGLVPMARQMTQNNMQLLSEEQYLSVVGQLTEQDFQGVGRAVEGGVIVSPDDIQGLFTFPISDASAPLDPVRFARTWVQVLQVSTASPILQQRVDIVKLWMELVRSLGIPDPTRLLLPQQLQVLPDEQIERQVQAGNLVPQQQPGGAPPLRAAIPNRPQSQSISGEENRPR